MVFYDSFFFCVWQNKTLPSRRPLWDGPPTSVTSVINSRCFTVRKDKQVKCHRPRKGNHSWLLRWWPLSLWPNAKFVHLSYLKKTYDAPISSQINICRKWSNYGPHETAPNDKQKEVWCYFGLWEPKRNRKIISSVCLLTIRFSVNHRLFHQSVSQGTLKLIPAVTWWEARISGTRPSLAHSHLGAT